MPIRRQTGISGYVGKSLAFKSKHRRGWKRRLRKTKGFANRVEKVLENTLMEQQQWINTSAVRVLSGARGNATGPTGAYNQQGIATYAIQNSYGDLASVYGRIGSSVQGMPGLTGKAMKFVVNSYQLKTMIKNQSNTSSIADVYECVSRRDGLNVPQNVFNDGMTDQNSGGSDLAVGVTPFQCNKFCTLFKILRKTRYALAPGAFECIEYRDSRKKVIDWERIAAVGSNAAQLYAGLSKFWLMIIYSEPISDSSTPAKVQPAGACVLVHTTEIYEYSYSVNNMVQTNYIDSTTPLVIGTETLLDTGALGVVATNT